MNNQICPCLTPLSCVRQGDILYLILFSPFLNDLRDSLSELNVSLLQLVQEKNFPELYTPLKVFVIVYSDDTILLADSKDGLVYGA